MKKTLIAIATVAAFGMSGAALANGLGLGGQGGNGGNGGAGGTGVGLGVGIAAATANAGANLDSTIRNSNSSRNTNVNANFNRVSNRNLNAQGQQQGQLQGQQQGIARSGNSHQSQGIAGSGNSSQGQSTANANNSAQAVTINQPAPDIPVATAYAAPLTAGYDTCMGSSTGAVQGMSVGISVGTTWTDGNCVALKDSARAQQMGMSDVAVAIMCQRSVFAQAMKDTGRTCPGDKVKVAESAPVHVASSGVADVSGPSVPHYVWRDGHFVLAN